MQGTKFTQNQENQVIDSKDTCEIEVQVPNRLVGIIIGKGGQTINGIKTKTGAIVQIAQNQLIKNKRLIKIRGQLSACLLAKCQIQKIVHLGLINLQKSGFLTADEAEMISPISAELQKLQK